MAKPYKQGKRGPDQQDNQPKQADKKNTLSGKFLDSIKDSLTEFSKLTEEKRISLYGNKPFLDQFYDYFRAEHPDLLGVFNKDELAACLEDLEGKGFSLPALRDNADKLHAEFAPEKPEREVMKNTLSSFDAFCKKDINNIPEGTFDKFAKAAGFNPETYDIPVDSELTTIDRLYTFWKDFAEKEHIELKEQQKKNIEQLLCPAYDPVERVMVQVAITKLGKEMKGKLKEAFDEQFPLPLTAFSAIGDLRVFRTEWLNFLEAHASQIDQPLAKKLDEVIVTNGDIRKLLSVSGKKFDQTKGYEEWERYFLRVFNKLATRQLFDQIKDTKEAVEKYVDVIEESVLGFPPYVNELFKVYPYNYNEVAQADPSLQGQLASLDTQITELESKIMAATTSDEERTRLRAKRKELKQKKEEARWHAYVLYLATKDKQLAAIVAKLVVSRFDFAQLSVADQQQLLNILVKNKLGDIIARKAPELLGVSPEELKQFTDDLFDLSKKDLTIPTRDGPVHIVFKEKKFISSQATQLLAVNDLAQLKSLPLQFVVEPTPSSQEFFEKGALWGHNGGMLFDTFESGRGPVVLNDGYKVRLTKNGSSVEGYLSQYPPADTDEKKSGEERYLYSEPVTHVSQERKKVTRDSEGKGDQVVIEKKDEPQYQVDVLDRTFFLNGGAVGSLIFAYVLGQKSFANEISPEKEKEFAKKMGQLDKFKDIQEYHEDPNIDDLGGGTLNALSERKEKDPYEKFLEGWKKLSGHEFPDDKADAGFKEGTRLYVKIGESDLPPYTISSDAWMYLDIVKIDRSKGTFTVKIHGGEYGLKDFEGVKKEIPIKASALDTLQDILGGDLYKVPPIHKKPFEEQLGMIKTMFGDIYDKQLTNAFGGLKADDGGFVFTQGDFTGEKIEGFGYDVKIPEYSEEKKRTIENTETVLFDIKRNADGTYRVSCKNDLIDENGKKLPGFTRDMDAVNFALFIAGKQLQPKATSETKKKKALPTKDEANLGLDLKRRPFSINNIKSFFKTSVGKIKDGIKKYDEDRAEDLTDLVLQQGDAFAKFGKMRGGLSSRIGQSFETAGLDYYAQRDARVWKKIEKRQKLFEQDKNYPNFLFKYLNDILTGKEKPRDIYKIPAVLLAVINKEKHPYARNFNLVGKGHRVNLLLGDKHKDRYMSILNSKMNEMREKSDASGGTWTSSRTEEIIRLEMKYIVSVISGGGEYAVGGDHDLAQVTKWSGAFADSLDQAMTKNFSSKAIVEKAGEIDPNGTFELSEYEYARNAKVNKPIAAFPYLKDMALKAQTPEQWQQVEMHIISGTMSGWFLYCADAGTKSWIKNICRSMGFLPGLFAKDIKQQSKMYSLMNIFLKSSGKTFDQLDIKPPFSLDKYRYGQLDDTGNFMAEGFKKWRLNNKNGAKVSKFLEFVGKDSEGKKTLVDYLDDPTLSESEKSIIKEYIGYSNESVQDLDREVRGNVSAMSRSPFTKGESLVRELMKYNDGEFEGANTGEKAGGGPFRNAVSKGLPKGKCSPGELDLYLGKFFNWFDGFGFADGNRRTLFLKRLRTIQSMLATGNAYVMKQAEDMLRYTINGTILNSNHSGKGSTPKEFEHALDAFRKFFKNNLDNILTPSTISSAMGSFYAKDKEANEPYALGNWAEYVEVMTDNTAFLDQKNKEKNKELRKKYKSGNKYAIYSQLFKLAEDLDRENKGTNRFKSYYDYDETRVGKPAPGSAPKLSKGGIAISNPKAPQEAISDVLTGREREPLSDEDYLAALSNGNDDYYND